MHPPRDRVVCCGSETGGTRRIDDNVASPIRRCLSFVAVFALTAPVSPRCRSAAKAPDFTLQAAQGGNVFTFSLADALKKGPVVLYFYPAAFTTGCTIEAHDFADAIDQYHALGATVIGVSHDQIDTLQKFSVSECRSKFAVAADTQQTVKKRTTPFLPQHPAVRQPDVLRDRARRHDHLHLYDARSVAARPKHAHRAQDLEDRPVGTPGAVTDDVTLSEGATPALSS